MFILQLTYRHYGEIKTKRSQIYGKCGECKQTQQIQIGTNAWLYGYVYMGDELKMIIGENNLKELHLNYQIKNAKYEQRCSSTFHCMLATLVAKESRKFQIFPLYSV